MYTESRPNKLCDVLRRVGVFLWTIWAIGSFVVFVIIRKMNVSLGSNHIQRNIFELDERTYKHFVADFCAINYFNYSISTDATARRGRVSLVLYGCVNWRRRYYLRLHTLRRYNRVRYKIYSRFFNNELILVMTHIVYSSTKRSFLVGLWFGKTAEHACWNKKTSVYDSHACFILLFTRRD